MLFIHYHEVNFLFCGQLNQQLNKLENVLFPSKIHTAAIWERRRKDNTKIQFKGVIKNVEEYTEILHDI